MTQTTATIDPGPARAARGGAASSDKLRMLAATLARMALGLVTFVLLARFLGPEPFGLIATAMAYTGFVGIVTDYGLSTSALRQAAAAPERTREVMADAIAVKALLTLVVGVVGGGALVAVMPPGRLAVYALVFAGALAYSLADLLLVAARANRRFDLEAKLVLSTSVVLLAGVGGVAAVTGSVIAVAAAFAVTRIGYLLLLAWTLRRWLGNPFARTKGELTATLRRSSSYAADNLLTTLSTQIDVLLFGAVLTLHDVGVYQAGARLVQVILPFAAVLSTVSLPTLTAAHARNDMAAFRIDGRRLTWEFAGLAVLGGIGFAIVGPIVTGLLYGSRYDALRPLWTGFAAFAVLRFTAAAYGVQLVAIGRIAPRIVAQLAAIGLFVVATALVLPRVGLPATAWLLALSALPPFLLLGLALIRHDRTARYLPASMAVSLVAAGILVAVRGLW